MTDDPLFFKEAKIQGRDVEIIFHKDYVWIFNERPLPVVSFTLTNCQGLETINFSEVDELNDGVYVNLRTENRHHICELRDAYGNTLQIICDKAIEVEREYNREDFIGLINEILKQRDMEHDAAVELNQQTKDLKHFLNRELEVVDRKITQADWLAEDKKHFLEGQQNVLTKIIAAIDRRENGDFQNQIKNETVN